MGAASLTQRFSLTSDPRKIAAGSGWEAGELQVPVDHFARQHRYGNESLAYVTYHPQRGANFLTTRPVWPLMK